MKELSPSIVPHHQSNKKPTDPVGFINHFEWLAI